MTVETVLPIMRIKLKGGKNVRYYTKEWYEQMQELYSVEDLRVIADKLYSDAEIQAFYDADLEEAIRRAHTDYETPPSFGVEEELQDPRQVIIFNEQTGEVSHPASLEEAREHMAQERLRREAEYANRPPFDPAETIEDFQDMYEALLQYGVQAYPQWVREAVDHRLLALRRVPERLYCRMKADSEARCRLFGLPKKKPGLLGNSRISRKIYARVFIFTMPGSMPLKRLDAMWYCIWMTLMGIRTM